MQGLFSIENQCNLPYQPIKKKSDSLNGGTKNIWQSSTSTPGKNF